ncbi:hypothetical protein EMCRGX_G031402 [Ephydatia muelleri]
MDTLKDESKIAELQAHTECVSFCRLIHHDDVIVTASYDRTIAFWSSLSGEKRQTLTKHSNRIVACCVNEVYELLLSASWDKTIILWDMTTGQHLWMQPHNTLVTSCHTNGQHCYASTTDSGKYILWDARTQSEITSKEAHATTITCCRFSHNGLNLCTCSMDRQACIWDVRMHRRLLLLGGHVNTVSSCAFSHNDHRLCTTSWDKSLRVYDIASGAYRLEGAVVLENHDGCVSSCDFSNDDSLVVSGGYDLGLNIWNMNTYLLKSCFKGHEGWIQNASFGENKKWIVSCARDGMVRIWNSEAGSNVYWLARKHKNTGLNIAKCEQCGKLFSMAESPDLCVCVLCRLQSPSRSLERITDELST